jgi:hypothetical protein
LPGTPGKPGWKWKELLLLLLLLQPVTLSIATSLLIK